MLGTGEQKNLAANLIFSGNFKHWLYIKFNYCKKNNRNVCKGFLR